MQVNRVDVLLLCAIPVEWDSLKSLLQGAVPDPNSNDPAIRGRMESDGRSFSAALVEVGMGLKPAAMATLKAVDKYNPSLVVFVGIAGGIKDVKIGDVVIANKVYDYETGKVADGQFQSRSDTRVSRADLIGIARNLRATYQPEEYRIFVGALASGDKVVADIKSTELKRIKSMGSDSLALEMEGSAVLDAIDRAQSNPDYFLVRGISDLVEEKTVTDREGGQERGISNACDATLALIMAWDNKNGVSVPIEQTRTDLLAAGMPMPAATEQFILVAPPHSTHAAAVIKSGFPVSLVIDLDPESEVSGLLAETRPALEAHRAVHRGSPQNPPTFGVSSTAWVNVQGFEDPVKELRPWTRTVRRHWRSMLSTFAADIGGRRTTILVADDGDLEWDEWRRALVDDLDTEFGDRINVGILGHGRSISGEDFRLDLIPAELQASLGTMAPDELPATARVLPGSQGLVELSPTDAQWICEDADIYWASEPDTSNKEAATLDFLHGGEISLAVLANDADVLRTQAVDIEKQLLGMLNNRATVRVNLFHAPGAGGTTLAHRLGFNIRVRFPVLFLSRFREGETVRRIEAISRQTTRTVLVIAETPAIRDDQVATLMDELRSVSLPAVVLAVSRAYRPPSEKSSSFYLPDVLDDIEAQSFVDTYNARGYADRHALQTLASYRDHRRNAFFFGLVTFEEDFKGIDAFVGGRLVGIEGPQREVMLVCSIAHLFGQAAVPEYALARLVGLPASKAGGFARALMPELRSLLWRSSEGEWRTTHPLVAAEILRQLGGGDVEWLQALSSWGKLFADFCLEDPEDEAMQHLVDSVFIERDDDAAQSNVNRESFARLIEKIPSRDGAAQLLTYLANLQPDQAHILAHTARYYALRMDDFETAERYAKQASKLSPESSTLHHILGMVHRSRVYDGVGRNVSLDDLSPWVAEAASEFAISRDLASSMQTHGYISEIQMRVKIVEHAIRGLKLAEYLMSTPHPLVVSSVEKAEDLISTLRYRGDPKKPSGFEQTERAKLSRLYGDYSAALQSLDSLLRRGTVPLPVVRRQLVWTYLARVERDWRKLPKKDVDRIVSLLDDNLAMERYSSSDALAWWRAVRFKTPAISHEKVKEVLAYWRASNPCLEAEYCSFVAYALDVLAGLPSSITEVSKHARRCADMAKNDGTRTQSVDWYGEGVGTASLVHHSELGKWDPALDFWADTSRLRLVEARVTQISGPQAGRAEIHGMSAFFVPQRAGVIRGRHENERIQGYLAFTHDGLRIWEPTLIG